MSLGRVLSGCIFCMVLNILDGLANLRRLGSSVCVLTYRAIGGIWSRIEFGCLVPVAEVRLPFESLMLVVSWLLAKFSVKSDISETSWAWCTFAWSFIFLSCFLDRCLITSRS